MAKTFPVLWQGHRAYLKALEDLGAPRDVPWDFVAEHNAQCLHNHDQTTQELANRGGLSVEEMLAVVRDMSLRTAGAQSWWRNPEQSVSLLRDAVGAWKRRRETGGL